MSGAELFLPSDWDARIEAAHDAYLRATWRTDLTDADRYWQELQDLRRDRDAFYAQHRRTR